MTFRKEKGRYEGVTSDGMVVKFEDAAEMKACAELRDSLLVLVGREPESAALVNPSVSRADSSLYTREPKKVRIRIDTEAEYVGNSEFGIRNSKLMAQKEKALA